MTCWNTAQRGYHGEKRAPEMLGKQLAFIATNTFRLLTFVHTLILTLHPHPARQPVSFQLQNVIK